MRNNHDQYTAAGEHFNQPGHSLEQFSFIAFEKVRSQDPFVLEAREQNWIEKGTGEREFSTTEATMAVVGGRTRRAR